MPHLTEECVAALASAGIESVSEMIAVVERKVDILLQILSPIIDERPTQQAIEVKSITLFPRSLSFLPV